MVKKTMAILGDTGKFSPILIDVFAKQELRLLFVSEAETKIEKLKKQLEPLKTAADIEFIRCEREGCWEADIILLIRSENISFALVEKIKEVATQKIVMVVSEDIKQPDKPVFEKLLPYSKVVEMVFDSRKKEFSVFGKDAEAKADVQNILESTGYQLNK
jgi:hypothetical protein